MLPRACGALRNCDVEGGSIGHWRAVKIVDRPLLGFLVVEDAHRVVVVDAPAATGVPVLGDRHDGAWAAVGQRVLQARWTKLSDAGGTTTSKVAPAATTARSWLKIAHFFLSAPSYQTPMLWP